MKKKEFTLQTKLFLVYALIISFILSITLFILFTSFSSSLKNRYIESLTQLSIKSTQQIESMIREMNQISLYSATNPSIRTYFITKQNSPSQELNLEQATLINETLMAIALPSNTPYLRTSIYDHAQNYVSLGIPDSQKIIQAKLQSEEFLTWYNEMDHQKSKYLLTPPHPDTWSSTNKVPLFSLFRVMKDVYSYLSYGIVEVQMPYTTLEDILSLGQNEQIKTLIYNNSNELIYPLSSDDPATLITFYTQNFPHTSHDLTSTSKVLTNPLTQHEEIVFYSYSNLANWTIIMTQETSQLLAPVYFMSKILGFSGISLILVLLIAIYFISKKMTAPLISLRDSVRTISFDNLSLDLGKASSLNEVRELETTFNLMFTQLKATMDDVILAKTQEMQAHMIALQSQMDPHFLYNILSVISAISREQNNLEISEICTKLSGMLRYISVYNEETVLFQSELNHLENYLSLMQIRFEDQLHYTIDIDKKFREIDLYIPKLILQPLAENCFQHGFKKVAPPWIIKLHASIDQDYWKVTIFDNGIGIPTSKIDEIKDQVSDFLRAPSKSIKDLTLGGMGLINILVRLKLFYQDDFIFDIQNGNYSSTQITIGGRIH